MSIEVICGNLWLSSIAQVTDLAWGHTADGGSKQATWKMDLPKTFSHPALIGRPVTRIKTGPANVFRGRLTEPDIDGDGWTFTAQGIAQACRAPGANGGGFLCFDPSYNTTSTPDVAIDRAIADGLPWTRPTSLSNAAFAATGSTDSLNYLGDLLDAWADQNGVRWGVNPDGQVYAAADPTTPTWFLTPDVGRFGLADDEFASDVFVRYQTGATTYATVTVADTDARSRFGRAEYPADATPRGVITSGTATALANGLMAKGKARMGVTNGITAARGQLTTPGGTPAFLPFVQAQQMVRQFGLVDDRGLPVPYVDWIIGETSLDAGSDSIGLTPVGLVPRTLTDVMASLVTS